MAPFFPLMGGPVLSADGWPRFSRMTGGPVFPFFPVAGMMGGLVLRPVLPPFFLAAFGCVVYWLVTSGSEAPVAECPSQWHAKHRVKENLGRSERVYFWLLAMAKALASGYAGVIVRNFTASRTLA